MQEIFKGEYRPEVSYGRSYPIRVFKVGEKYVAYGPNGWKDVVYTASKWRKMKAYLEDIGYKKVLGR